MISGCAQSSKASASMPFICSTGTATCSPGTPAPSASRATKRTRCSGLHFSRFFTRGDQERGRPAELLRQAAARDRVEEEGWRVRKDGSRFWANVVITAIRDSSGEVTGFAKITRDVTEHKQAQESVISELSGLLLANVEFASCSERSPPASARWFRTTPRRWRFTKRRPASCACSSSTFRRH